MNAPLAAIAFFAALPLLPESRTTGDARYDIPGSILVTAGLALLVYGFAEAVSSSWSSSTTIGSLVGGGVLLVAFVAVQVRSRNPLLPLRVVMDRNRGGSFLSSLLIFLAMMGMFLFLTYYLQGVLGYSALKTGLAMLPLASVVIVASGSVAGLMRVVSPRFIISGSFLICAIALVWFSRIGPQNDYVGHILGPEIVVGLGIGGILVPATNLALLGVSGRDSGVASGSGKCRSAGRRLNRHCDAEYRGCHNRRRVSSQPPRKRRESASNYRRSHRPWLFGGIPRRRRNFRRGRCGRLRADKRQRQGSRRCRHSDG